MLASRKQVLLFLAFFLPGIAAAQDLSKIGGELTSSLPGRHAIQVNAPNVVDESRRVKQLEGFGEFHGVFTRKTGLGPLFVNSSCKGCHVENGRGPTKFSRSNDAGSSMVVKVSLRGLSPNGAPKDVPGIGEQLLDHQVSGAPKTDIKLLWEFVEGLYPDGLKYRLRKPKLTFRVDGYNSRKLVSSLRMTPPVIGPGLLEAVSEKQILEFSDPFDLDKDGISGKPNYVIDVKTGQYSLGRFGFKASHPTLEQQSAAALIHDTGITNPLFPQADSFAGNPTEYTQQRLDLLVIYQKLAGVPAAIKQDDEKVIAGKKTFQLIGCNKCHRMTLTTGEVADPELSNQEFHPFTDLLLHDMGKDLADKRAEFSAKGSEWKTTPLWGLGFSRRLAGKKAAFLHDGRARTIEEAILWHGGEAAKVTEAFKKLSESEREKLLAFLDSL